MGINAFYIIQFTTRCYVCVLIFSVVFLGGMFLNLLPESDASDHKASTSCVSPFSLCQTLDENPPFQNLATELDIVGYVTHADAHSVGLLLGTGDN